MLMATICHLNRQAFLTYFVFKVCGKNARAENDICKNVRGKMQQIKMPEATWSNVIGNNPISKNARDKTYTSLVLYLTSM